MTILGGHNRPVWPDAAGTATLPTTAFVRSTRIFDVEGESELHLRATVSGVGMGAVAVDVLINFDPNAATTDTTWRRYARRSIPGAAVGGHDFGPIRLPPRCRAVVDLRGWRPDVDSRVVVTGDLRAPGSEAAVDGQPLELVGHHLAGLECYSDGAGAPTAMAASPAAHAPVPAGAAAQLWYPVGDADYAVVQMAVSAVLATNIEVMVRQRRPGSAVEAERVAVNSVTGGVVSQQASIEQLPGAIDTVITRECYVEPGSEVLVLARRVGGAAGTLAIGHMRLFRLGRS